MPVREAIPATPTPEAAVAEMGHNMPPIEERVASEFREQLLTDRPDFETRLAAMIEAAGRVDVQDDVSLGKAGDLIKMYRAAEGHINDTHKAVKEPYLKGGRAADAEKNALITRIQPARDKVQALMNTYASKKAAEERAERERIEAEQRAAAERAAAAERELEKAEREAAEAAANAASEEERRAAQERADKANAEAEAAMREAALAPAAVAAPEPVRSDAGSTVSGRQVWNSQVTDYQVAFIAVEDNPKVREAIDKAIAQLVKAGKRQIDGVRIWPTAQAIAR